MKYNEQHYELKFDFDEMHKTRIKYKLALSTNAAHKPGVEEAKAGDKQIEDEGHDIDTKLTMTEEVDQSIGIKHNQFASLERIEGEMNEKDESQKEPSSWTVEYPVLAYRSESLRQNRFCIKNIA